MLNNVSILLPVYNAEKYLTSSIESILNQTYQNFEFIIADDCSNDNSVSIIKSYAQKDKRITVLLNEKNLGIAANRNKLFSHISINSEYIALFDADDICLQNRLISQINFLKSNPDIDVVGSSLIVINEFSQKIGLRKYPSSHKSIKKSIMRFNPIANPSVMLRTSVMENIGYYNTSYKVCEDYDYWLRTLKHHKMANLVDPLVYYRISPTQSKQKYIKETVLNSLNIQRKYLMDKEYFSIRNLVFHLIKYLVLLFPVKTVLRLFLRKTYNLELHELDNKVSTSKIEAI